MMSEATFRKDFVIQIVLPTVLAILLFTLTIFTIIIPSFKTAIMDRKREMIRELTHSALSVLSEFHQMEQDGVISRTDAQQNAATVIEYLRYGAEGKDYFWITDMHPNMIMHPYIPELNGTDLSDYQDPEGKRLFTAFVNTVKLSGEGYVDYMWQWKDDPSRIVPKLSYVKQFEPWKWIIGTGIYLDDVDREIAALTKRLLLISLGILAILALILMYIMQQSLKIETKRLRAEGSLRESEEKYRALVEASTDGLVMILNGKFAYANQTVFKMLDAQPEDHDYRILRKLLTDGNNSVTTAGRFFKDLLDGKEVVSQFAGQIDTLNGQPVDVLLFTSPIEFARQPGFTIIVKDMSSYRQKTGSLNVSRSTIMNLTDAIRIGVFRTTLGRKGKFIEANEAVLLILGYQSEDTLFKQNIFNLFYDPSDRRQFLRVLSSEGIILHHGFKIRRGDGKSTIVSVSAVLINDENGTPVYCDGMIEDITERKARDDQIETLLSELQTAQYVLNQPIKHFVGSTPSCHMTTPVHKVAALMTDTHYSAALIQTEEGQFTGIVTDRDIRERVVTRKIDPELPVFKIMTAPLITISENAMVFEAFARMRTQNTRHLAVVNTGGEITGTISSEELLHVQQSSTSFMLRELQSADTVEKIKAIHNRLSLIVKTLVDSGAKVKTVTRIITSVSDAIVTRLIELALEELGNPPAPFAFMAMGSEGREEQTLITDQDNAIIYAHDDPDTESEVHDYFVNLGRNVCDRLATCGYTYCKGNNMAKNPQWTQPICKWKQYFSTWINTSDPQDLIEIGIFFDFRCIYGDSELTDDLRNHIFDASRNKAAFFQHLVKNCLTHKLPLGLLGNIVVKSSGEHPETFDIKKAIMPVTDFARIHALKNRISETNTLDRLNKLWQLNIIAGQTYHELEQAYNVLMQIRFKHQTTALAKNLSPNNFINPANLTQIEQKTMKNTFTQITGIQKKLSYEFTGEAI